MKFSDENVTNTDYQNFVEILKKPLAEWTLDEAQFSLPAVTGLLTVVITTFTIESDQIDNDFISAIGDIVNHIRKLGGHLHDEEKWRSGVREVAEDVENQNLSRYFR